MEHAEKVVGVVFVADNESAEVLEPSKEALSGKGLARY